MPTWSEILPIGFGQVCSDVGNVEAGTGFDRKS